MTPGDQTGNDDRARKRASRRGHQALPWTARSEQEHDARDLIEKLKNPLTADANEAARRLVALWSTQAIYWLRGMRILQQDAEDLFQDAIIKLWHTHAAKYNPAMNPTRWFFNLLNYLVYVHWRTPRRRAQQLDKVHENLKEEFKKTELPENCSTDAEIKLKKAIESLPEQLKLPIMQVYSEGLTHRAAAQASGMTYGAWGSLYRKALGALRDALERHMSHPFQES